MAYFIQKRLITFSIFQNFSVIDRKAHEFIWAKYNPINYEIKMSLLSTAFMFQGDMFINS